MKKLKVMTIVGTRPEIIRLSRVLAKLDATCEHILVHTGQNYDYELNQIFFEGLGLRAPDHVLDAAGESACETIGNIIARIDPLLAKVSPDAVLVLGDTNSCLAVIAAKRRKIPIFHMEAGNRCFDARVPEEINRKMVDQLADINMPYSDIAREYLLRDGLPPDRIIKTGSPMAEVLAHYKPQFAASDVLTRLNLKPEGYFVVSCHREENIDNPTNFAGLIAVLDGLVKQYNLPIIFAAHPRTRKRIEEQKVARDPRIQLMKPLGFADYVRLQMDAKAVLSDSGTISEESSILNFPALNIREAHERPEAMEEASVMLTGLSPERVLQAMAILETQPRGATRALRQVADYAMPNVSDKVVRIILSYVDVINRNTWRKDA